MRRLGFGAGVVVVGALAMSACGTSGGSSKQGAPATAPRAASDSTTTTTAAAPTSSAAPTTEPTSAPAAPAPSAGSVPVYQPSSVVSQATGHTQLTSPDDVAKVTAFYQQALSQDGWGLTSSAKTAASANFVAKRSGTGTTVAVSTTGPSGTSISISTYPG